MQEQSKPNKEHLYGKHLHYPSLQRCSQGGLPTHLPLSNPHSLTSEVTAKLASASGKPFTSSEPFIPSEPFASQTPPSADVAPQEASEPFNIFYNDGMQHLWLKRAAAPPCSEPPTVAAPRAAKPDLALVSHCRLTRYTSAAPPCSKPDLIRTLKRPNLPARHEANPEL